MSQDEQKEGYIFHLLSDQVSQSSQNKLQALAKELNQIYPCVIQVHICDDLPAYANSPLCFRLFIPRFMPKNLSRCLYLDSDMLVLQDLRVLFALQFNDKIAGVIKDNIWVIRSAHKSYKPFRDFYFNSGFLLMNLNEWHKQSILEKCLEFLTHHKDKVRFVDQDALNYAIPKEKALVLPFQYNLFVSTFSSAVFNDDRKKFAFDYTRKEGNFALLNPAIVHFISLKPWANPYQPVDNKGKALGLYWWDIALQTPLFKDELQKDFDALQKNILPQKAFENYVSLLIVKNSKDFLGYLKIPFAVCKVFKDKEKGKINTEMLNLKEHNFSPNEYNLAGAIFSVAHQAFIHKYKGRLLDLPYRVWRLKLRYEKYGSAKAIQDKQ